MPNFIFKILYDLASSIFFGIKSKSPIAIVNEVYNIFLPELKYVEIRLLFFLVHKSSHAVLNAASSELMPLEFFLHQKAPSSKFKLLSILSIDFK